MKASLGRFLLAMLVIASAWAWSPAARATTYTCPYTTANNCVGWMWEWWQIENGTYFGVGALPTGRLWTFSGNIAGGQHTVQVQVPTVGFALANVYLDGSPYGTFTAQLVSAQKEDTVQTYSYPGGWYSGLASAMTLNLNINGQIYQIVLAQVQNTINQGLYCFTIVGSGVTCNIH
ncbi:MAG: hypothetical protein ABIG70_04770 [Pseudomonadota bacterium]